MRTWDWHNIEAATGGVWLVAPEVGAPAPSGCAIDSREVRPGVAFFALRGERTDGHAYAGQAASRGAALIVVEDEIGPPSASAAVLRVPSVRDALRALAAAYRDVLAEAGVHLIAVTGSNGKTTCVRLMHGALSTTLTGTHSQKSHNNDLGVPLTILNARTSDDYLICEVGTNAPGEIASLSALVRPRVAVVTSVGRAHIEKLGSVAGVASEKLSMLDHVEPGVGGLAIVFVPDGPEEVHLELARRGDHAFPVRRVGSSSGADVRVTATDREGGIDVLIDGARFHAPVSGTHNRVNAAMAVHVARELGCTDDAIRQGLASAEPPPMRLAVRQVPLPGGACTLINDAYNANPESMSAAVRHLATAVAASRRIAVLGDMLELGELGPASHLEIGELIAATRAADVVVLVGQLMPNAAAPIRAALGDARVIQHAAADESSSKAVALLIEPGDVVLLKGSRAIGLERIATAIEQRAADAAPSAGGTRAV